MKAKEFLVLLLAILAIVLVVSMWARGVTAEEPIDVDVDVAIVFVADVSTSMEPYEIAMMREAHAGALVSSEVQTAIADSATGRIAVAYVEFGDFAEIRVGWTLVDGYEAAHGVAAVIRTLPGDARLGCCTKVGRGLNLAAALFDDLPYRPLRLVVDVFGDGPGDDPGVSVLALAALEGKGAVVNGLPLVVSPDRGVEAWYADHIKRGPGSFLVPISSLEQAPEAMRQKIVLELY